MHIEVCVFLNFGFLRVNALQWDSWVIIWFYSQFFKGISILFSQWLYQFIFPPTVQEVSLFSITSPAFTVCRLFDDGLSDWWRSKWQCIPVFLSGEPHGQRSLVGYSPWGYTELDTTEATQHAHVLFLSEKLYAFINIILYLQNVLFV